MQISEAAAGVPTPAVGAEPCRFPKLEECAHFHYERVQLPQLTVALQTSMDQSLHSQHTHDEEDAEFYMVQVTSGDECWLVQRNYENFKMLDAQLHQCIYDRKISQLPDLSSHQLEDADVEELLMGYLARFSTIADNSLNCGPILNWFQMDNKGHRLLVPSEESRSINTPAVAAAYSVRRYVSQARDELNLEVGDMISVIDMASPGESIWWRGKRGFQVGFFPQHCVHIIGDKVPRNMPLPPPVVGSLALSPIKPVLRKHGKLITFFRSFILNRPSRRRLKQSGILKERVFGCDLGEHLLNSGNDVPMVLKCCAEFIETHGIVDGIYRLSGVTSNIQKLRNAFDEDRIPNLYTEDILQDIHSVASLLKMYFRELPNPLCTYQLYQSFVNAVQGCSSATRNSENDHERLLKMREAVQKLPPPHYRTLEYLMRHLAKVAKHGASTGMTTRNVAIVWAPNLLRCAELEVGGVAALQGVGVQAVVTEFLICYTDLIFCDHLPNLDHPSLLSGTTLSPKRCRPKSLAISTPTKLITLEEARTKHMINRADECNYIEVGGGPNNLPKKYHTVIELPANRKRNLVKRSPLGWRSFFSKSRNNSQGNISKNRKASTPGIIVPDTVLKDKAITESDLTDIKRKLRSVKSAESLTSGHSEPASNELDVLGPLHTLNKPPGHNRSVSHDSYFDTLQSSQNNSEGSLLDLSEIQLNFELEESEMRIFSEDESLVSSPRIPRDSAQRRILTRSRPDEYSSNTNSSNPSPKKQPRVVLSPESMCRKRTRLEDQLSDIQYIDCNTPESNYTISTTAVIHTLPEPQKTPDFRNSESYQPKNKSPRNSEVENKRQSLNLERSPKAQIPKSLTDTKLLALNSSSAFGSPQSPVYRPLCDSSTATTPEFSPVTEIRYQSLPSKPKPSPQYENVLTTINITYKSPTKTKSDSVYEDVLVNPEKAEVPTSVASLPIQQASQPIDSWLVVPEKEESRPKSLSALEDSNPKIVDTRTNVSMEALFDVTEPNPKLEERSQQDNFTVSSISEKNLSSDPSIDLNSSEISETAFRKSDLTLSEVIQSLTETSASNSVTTPPSPTLSPNVSPSYPKSTLLDGSKNPSQNSLLSSTDDLKEDGPNYDLIDFSPDEPRNVNEKRKSSETEAMDDNAVYQQVKYFRRSVHEINALLDLPPAGEDIKMDTVDDKVTPNEDTFDSLEENGVGVYENVDVVPVYENVDLKDSLEDNTVREETSVNVRNLTDLFEVKEVKKVETLRPKINYDKDSLPPCLRAKNLKNQIKTRSLDEEEFKREFLPLQRRKSMDEDISNKMNTLPKVLNQPKAVPSGDGKIESIHLAHSNENMATSEQLRRERIEKYKEERRKFLQDKYRSESFKEDKDVLLLRLKLFKCKDERPNQDDGEENRYHRYRRKSQEADKKSDTEISDKDSDKKEEVKNDDETHRHSSRRTREPVSTNNSELCDKEDGSLVGDDLIKTDDFRESFLSKTAMFESHLNQRRTQDVAKKKDDEILRTKRSEDESLRNERRRHTYESRDRENLAERTRRVSLETKSPRKEKPPATYCIRDMKAIFESKSKQ